MRLNEMYYLINSTLSHWIEPEILEIRKDSRIESYCCDNLTSFVEFLSPLKVLPIVQSGIESVCNVSPKVNTGGRVFLNASNVSVVRNTSSEIRQSLTAMKEMCEALGVEPRKDGFDVKLPPDISLEELSKLTKDINTVFSQCPILRNEDGTIQLNGVDIGSKWLVFTVIGTGCIAVLKKLAELVDKAVMIRSHWLNCKEQEEHVKKLELSNEVLAQTISIHAAIMGKLKDSAVNELAEKYGVDDNEERERLTLSLDLLEDWMNKGMEIYAAIGAQNDVKAVFPPVEQQELPETAAKMLEAPKTEE